VTEITLTICIPTKVVSMTHETVINNEQTDIRNRILKQTDLYEILPFKKTKIQQLIRSGELPVMKVGKDYITSFTLLEKWIEENVGTEIYF